MMSTYGVPLILDFFEKVKVTHYCDCHDGFVNVGWQ